MYNPGYQPDYDSDASELAFYSDKRRQPERGYSPAGRGYQKGQGRHYGEPRDQVADDRYFDDGGARGSDNRYEPHRYDDQAQDRSYNDSRGYLTDEPKGRDPYGDDRNRGREYGSRSYEEDAYRDKDYGGNRQQNYSRNDDYNRGRADDRRGGIGGREDHYHDKERRADLYDERRGGGGYSSRGSDRGRGFGEHDDRESDRTQRNDRAKDSYSRSSHRRGGNDSRDPYGTPDRGYDEYSGRSTGNQSDRKRDRYQEAPKGDYYGDSDDKYNDDYLNNKDGYKSSTFRPPTSSKTSKQDGRGRNRNDVQDPEPTDLMPDYLDADDSDIEPSRQRTSGKDDGGVNIHRDHKEYNSNREQFSVPDYDGADSRANSPTSKPPTGEHPDSAIPSPMRGEKPDSRSSKDSSKTSGETSSKDNSKTSGETAFTDLTGAAILAPDASVSEYETDTDYEDSIVVDLDKLSIHSVDIMRTLHIRRRVTRNRLPILRVQGHTDKGQGEGQEKMAETGLQPQQQHRAQDLVNMFRDLKRDQIQAESAKELSGVDKLKFKGAKRFKTTQSSFNQFLSYFEIWRGSFKKIEGNFGSSIGAYFRFVKWLFLMNLFTFILILCVIVLPQELIQPDSFNDSMYGISMDCGYSDDQYERHDEALNCSAYYDEKLDKITTENDVAYYILDFFLGTGWMEDTVLFAGYYFNKTHYYEQYNVTPTADPDEPLGTLYYNLPVAYLSGSAVYFVVILILMVNYTGKGLKDRLVNSGDKYNRCCVMVLCGWDYNLNTDKAARLKHKNIFSEFFNYVAEQELARKMEEMTTGRRVGLFMIRVLIWLFVFGVWIASFALIVFVVGTAVPRLLADPKVDGNPMLTLVVEILPSITLTAINVVAQPLFQIIVQFEQYRPETEVAITIARTVVLRLASIGVLSFSLHNRITEPESLPDGPRYVCGQPENISCWETYVGQEYYKLVVVDFFVIVGVTLLVEFPRRLLVKKFPDNFVLSKVGLQEFELPKNVLEIVYTQTICWVGGFFSPLIPAITFFKLFVFFYVKKLSLLKNCVPAKRPYRASKSNYFFMLIMLISYTMSLFIISYAIGRIPPSKSCGPWRVYSRPEEFFIYTCVTDAIALLPEAASKFFSILSNWVFYVTLLILLILIIFYYQAIAAGNRRKCELLKEQLASEGMDKQFLLRQVNLVLVKSTIN